MKYLVYGYSKDGHLLGIADVIAENEGEAEKSYRNDHPDICVVKFDQTEPNHGQNTPALKPINRDAARILQPMAQFTPKSDWTSKEEEEIRWAGAISKCPSCGGRAYEGGYCFSCGRVMIRGTGIKKTENET